jgi:hypothetical protein
MLFVHKYLATINTLSLSLLSAFLFFDLQHIFNHAMHKHFLLGEEESACLVVIPEGW